LGICKLFVELLFTTQRSSNTYLESYFPHIRDTKSFQFSLKIIKNRVSCIALLCSAWNH